MQPGQLEETSLKDTNSFVWGYAMVPLQAEEDDWLAHPIMRLCHFCRMKPFALSCHLTIQV